MNTAEAQRECLELMTAYGLMDWNRPERMWSFRWMRSKRTLGNCNHTHRVISLSKPYVRLNPEHVVRDTILHEIAHALAGYDAGHGNAWKLKAIELGAKPEACKDSRTFPGFVRIPGKYRATCAICGQWYERERLPKANTICRCGICWSIDREKSKLNYERVCA